MLLRKGVKYSSLFKRTHVASSFVGTRDVFVPLRKTVVRVVESPYRARTILRRWVGCGTTSEHRTRTILRRLVGCGTTS